MVVRSNHLSLEKTYMINRCPTFLKGNKNINKKFPIWSHILFLLFPFNQQYGTIAYLSNNIIISLIINLYLYGSVFAYYMSLFLLAYTISPERGGLSISNQCLKEWVLIFIGILPVYLLSLINGPKSLWLSNSFLTQTKFFNMIKRNFIIGGIIAILTIGFGYVSKYRHDLAREKYKRELLEIIPDYEMRKEKYYCKEHIDSILYDLIATYALADDRFCNTLTDQKGALILKIELDYQNAIKDSIGSAEYYPYHRDSLKPNQWYANIATNVISQSFKK